MSSDLATGIILFLVGVVAGYALYAIRLRLGPIPPFILRIIFDPLPRSVVIFTRDKRYHYITPYLEKFFGMARSQAIGKRHADLADMGIKTPVPEGLDTALAGQIHEEPLVPTILNSIVVGWRTGIYWPIRNMRGQIINVMFIAQRMDDAHRAYEQIQRQAMILASVKDSIVTVDLNNRIIDWNKAAETLYGYTAEEALGQPISQLLRSFMNEQESTQLRKELHEKGFWQGRLVRYTKSNRRMVVETHATPFHDINGETIGYIGLSYEVTKHVEMEEALRKSEERYRSLFENAVEGIFRSTLEGQFVEVNPALIDLLGYDSAAEMLTLKLPEVICTLIQNNPPNMLNMVDVFWHKKDDALIIVDVSARLTFDGQGTPLYFDGTIVDVTERRQAEEALRQSEERFRAVVENGTDIIGILDGNGSVTYVSPTVQRILGYDFESIEGENPFNFVHTDDLTATRDFVTHAVAGISTTNGDAALQTRIRHKDGSWRDFEITSSSPLNYPHLKGIIINARDVTERRLVNEKLRRQNEYLTALNETSLSLIERLDLDELLEDIIQRANKLLGAPQGYIFLLEPDGHTMKARVVVGLNQRLKGYLLKRGHELSGRVWESGQTIVVNNYENWSDSQYDFRLRQMRASIAAPLKSGHLVVGVLGLSHTDPALSFSPDEIALLNRFAELASIALDNARLYSAAQKELVDRTRADEELRQLNVELELRVEQRTAELQRREAQLSGVLDAMGEGVFFSESFHIRYTNRALADMTGYEIVELIDQPNAIFKSEKASPEDAARFTEEFVTPGQVWRGELTIRRKDGTEFPAGLTVALVSDANTNIFGAVTVVRDITQEKELAEQKSSFLANASHELRTPLTNFKTRLYLVRKQPERLDIHVEVLDRVTDRMTALVEDLLDASRFERGVIPLQRDDITLQPLIEDVVLLQQPEAQRKNIKLTTKMPNEPVHVFADSNRVVQVLVNLVVNAINYTDNEGRVCVELLAQPEDHKVIIRVQDTGTGIAPEHLPHIFDAFFRGSEGSVHGTGLGLFISKEIVDLHGGALTVESKLGEGTTFTVCLPLDEKPATGEHQPA